jgi:hypothetical protein
MNDLGWSQAGGMGAVPISSSELLSWSRLYQITLLDWEIKAMKQASRSYVSQSYEESNVAPYAKAKPKLLSKFKSLAAKVNK